MQNDPSVVQARIDKLLARISLLETENKELQGTLSTMSAQMEEKEKAIREGLAVLEEVTMARDHLARETERLEAERVALHAHMDELRDILLKDNDAQTVLDALRHLSRKAKK